MPRRAGAAAGARAAAVLATAAALLATAPAAARGQALPPPGDAGPSIYPGWVGEFTVFSGNVLLGALTAGVSRWLRHGSFEDGFTRGALGGGVVYAGKRLAVGRFDGAGLLGREVAAVGSSVVANAGAGRATLERIDLPVMVGWVRLDRAGGRTRLDGRIDLVPLAVLAYGVAQDRLDLDVAASLSAGAPVFRASGLLFRSRLTGAQPATGVELASSVWLSEVPRFGISYSRRVFAHERVHVAQNDFFTIAWGGPLEEFIHSRLAPRGGALRRIGVGLGDPILNALSALVPHYGQRPWELEANFLEGR